MARLKVGCVGPDSRIRSIPVEGADSWEDGRAEHRIGMGPVSKAILPYGRMNPLPEATPSSSLETMPAKADATPAGAGALRTIIGRKSSQVP